MLLRKFEEKSSPQALEQASARDRSARSRRIRVLSRWVMFGHAVEVVGVYLTALGLAVLAADLVLGGFQIAEAELARVRVSAAGQVPYLPVGQVTGVLWLLGLPLWGLGSALRRNRTLWLNRHASRGEGAEPLESRYALRWPAACRFRGRQRK